MATGDTNDIRKRLKAVLPLRWFPDKAPILDGVLTAFGTAASFIYSAISFAKLQTRISTASGMFLDIAAYDFFGRRIQRKTGQNDSSFAATIQAEVLRDRVTRAGVKKAVQDLTGSPVSIFEPFNPQDTGGFGICFAFNAAGAWGSDDLPYTMFVNAIEPIGAGIPNLSGLNDSYGGFGAGAFAFADVSKISGNVTNQDIYDAINTSRAAGITVWVKIGSPPLPQFHLDEDFVLDSSTLA